MKKLIESSKTKITLAEYNYGNVLNMGHKFHKFLQI